MSVIKLCFLIGIQQIFWPDFTFEYHEFNPMISVKNTRMLSAKREDVFYELLSRIVDDYEKSWHEIYPMLYCV